MIGMLQRVINVGLKGGMAGVSLEKSKRFLDLLDQTRVTRRTFQTIPFLPGFGGENQIKHYSWGRTSRSPPWL